MADLDVGAITGRIELKDDFSSALSTAIKKVDEFDESTKKLASNMSQTTNAQFAASVEHLKQLRAAHDGAASAAGANDSKSSGLAKTYREMDSVLKLVGINVKEQVKGVDELTNALSKGGEGLSTFAKAGLVAGAAFGGWKIGRVVADFFDLDKKIGDTTAKLLGWGDAAGEAAAAKADALALASQRAGHEIKTMAEALAFNDKWLTQHNKDAKEAADAAKKMADAMEELDSAGDGYLGTLQQIDGETVESVKYYLEAGVSQSALATAYGLTATQVKAVATAMQEEKQAIQESEAAWKKEQKEIDETTRTWNEYFALRDSLSGTTTEKQMADIDRWFADEVSKLDYSTDAWKEHYQALEALAEEKKGALTVDWEALRAVSRDTLQEIADKAEATYQAALADSSQYSRGAIEHFRAVRDEAVNNLRNWRDQAVGGVEQLGDSAKDAAKEVLGIGDAFDKVKQKVEEKYTMSFNSAEEVMNATGLTDTVREQLLAYFERQDRTKAGDKKATGRGAESVPSMADSGNEAVSSAAPAGVGMVNHFYVNGTAEEVAKKVGDTLVQNAKYGKLFGGR